MQIFKVLLFALLVVNIGGCFFEEEKMEDEFNCPSLSDDITWNSYGSFELKKAGNDSTARKIISECGWHVFNRHNGGYGDTLQIAPRNEEVVFIWAYNKFYGFVLYDGWRGATHNGAMMRDHISEFYGMHPEFSYIRQDLSEYEAENTLVRAYFDEGDFLEEIYVGYFF